MLMVLDIRKDMELEMTKSKLPICPTCYSEINEQHVEHSKEKINKAITKIDNGLALIDVDILILNEKNAYNLQIDEKLQDIRNDIILIDREVKSAQSFITKYEQMIADIDKAGEGVEVRKAELKTTKTVVESKEAELSELSSQIAVLQECQRHLKDDGIKASLIDQFIPIFNSLVNKYLGMMDFFVRFELDKEFNETIKSRHRDEFSYYSFSEGEKQQIDLALLFAWRELTMLSGNALTNIIVLDEVFDSSLDGDITDLVIGILGGMDTNTNIVVISHKPSTTFDTFERTISFEKIKNFSVMREL